MNYCPNCGTANRDGSRFCNECGHKLPSKTGIVCPMCSHINPAANVYCDKCQARLVPAAPGAVPAPPAAGAAPIKKGLSLPTKPADESEPEPEPEHEETPDWLMRLRAAAPRPADAPRRSETPDLPPGSDELPEWMRPAEGEVPDWFERLSEPFDAASHSLQSGTSQGRPSPEAIDSELPDWLRHLEAEAEPPPQAAGEGRPAAPPTPPAAPAPSADVPGWLAAMREPPFDSAQGRLAPETPAEEQPDWLSGRQLSHIPVAQPSGDLRPQKGQMPPAEEEPAAEEPDWLAAIREPPAAETPAEEEPDWLSGRQLQMPTAPDEAAREPETAPASDEVPAWLRELPSGDLRPRAGQPESAAADSRAPVEGGLVPPAPPAGVSAFFEEDLELPDQAETPDWLTDVVQPPLVAAPEQAAGDSGLAPPILPDWLRDLGPMPAPALRSPRPEGVGSRSPAKSPNEPPDEGRWSGERSEGTVEGAEARPEEIPFGEGPPAEAGDIPEWLRAMRPGQAPPAFADETGRSLAPAEAGLEAATLPSWLQALRPTAEGGLAPPAPEEGVAETEGLLADLRNVLPAMSFMGQSHGTPAVRHADIPAADLARAGLFQELLARGSLAPTLVRPSPAIGSRLRARVSSWLIALAIFAAAFTPNVSEFIAGIFQLGGAPVGLYQPAAERIASLNAGDRVLLAFDYDAFQAGEMDATAQAFLTHIRQRGADVIAVSLSPTGPALADRVLAQVRATLAVAPEDAGFVQRLYVPGQAIGAQSALISTQADLVVVLAGSPEAMRVWVEQVGAAGLPTPIAAGVSAGALPQIRPYVQSGQVTEPVTGLIGGLAYQRSLDPNPDTGSAALNRTVQSEALYLSQLTFAAILILGLIVSWMAGTPLPAVGDLARRAG